MSINPEKLVVGKRAVSEVLKRSPQQIEKVVSAAKELDSEIAKLIEKNRIIVKKIQADELSALSGSASHQSVAVVLKERRYASIHEIIQESEYKPNSLLVMLDGVTDPHNLGAVMRAAECFGADGVIWSKNRAASITPVVSKSAAGATELLPLVPVSNLADTLRKLKDAGYWVVASALTDKASPLDEFDPPQKVVLVLGSEGKGISQLVLKLSDFVIQVPMEGAIASLNVSQAASVFLYELRKKLNQHL